MCVMGDTGPSPHPTRSYEEPLVGQTAARPLASLCSSERWGEIQPNPASPMAPSEPRRDESIRQRSNQGWLWRGLGGGRDSVTTQSRGALCHPQIPAGGFVSRRE